MDLQPKTYKKIIWGTTVLFALCLKCSCYVLSLTKNPAVAGRVSQLDLMVSAVLPPWVCSSQIHRTQQLSTWHQVKTFDFHLFDGQSQTHLPITPLPFLFFPFIANNGGTLRATSLWPIFVENNQSRDGKWAFTLDILNCRIFWSRCLY